MIASTQYLHIGTETADLKKNSDLDLLSEESNSEVLWHQSLMSHQIAHFSRQEAPLAIYFNNWNY